MSLLMDALKRAEQNKQDTATAVTKPTGTTDELKLEPLSERSAIDGPVTLPELADYIDALDADLAASAAVPPPRSTPGQRTSPVATPLPDAGRQVVRNSFAAKEPPPSPRQAMWLVLGLLGLAAVGISGYVWYQIYGVGRSSLAVAPVPSLSAKVMPASPAVVPQPAAVPVYIPPTLAPNTPSVERPISPLPATPPREPEAIEPMPDRPAESAPVAQIRLVRTRPEVDSNLSRGYQNLQSGNIEFAHRDYQQALKRDPKNVDALLGMAAIAQREGRAADAERYWQHAFEADPKNAAAQAAVVSLASAIDPVTAESRLKTLLAAQPESGPLNFALGNLYSRQSRWPEAQQVYFNAVAADGDNPDYLFNLAVSLDHLRQPKLAAQHYRLALEAAERRTSAFDQEQVKKRLQNLQL